MSKSILVTGAAGFIGSHVSQAFAGRGDRVTGLDCYDDYYDPARKRRNIAEVRAALAERAVAFECVEGDLRDAQFLARLFSERAFDVVVHLGALAGVRHSIAHAARYFDVNVGGTICVLDACVNHHVPKFVLASTSSVYGNSERYPSTEDEPCDRPLAPYPASKRCAEIIGHSYHNLHGLDFTALRFFTVYGPRNRPDMMALMLFDSIEHGRTIQLYENGQLHRDWTYVGDIAAAVVAAADARLGYETINIGRGEPILLADFVSMVEDAVGRKARLQSAPMPAADMHKTFADISKARRLLGYAPTTSVREGVQNLHAWYRGLSLDPAEIHR